MEPPPQKSSQWLNSTIIACGVLMFGRIFWEGHIPGGSLHDALWSWHQRETESGPSAAELARAVTLQAGLIWFTFFQVMSVSRKATRSLVLGCSAAQRLLG